MTPTTAGAGQDPTATTGMTRQSHEAIFPIASGVHVDASCNSCHGGFDTFKEFTCLTCHEHEQATTNAQHTGVADFVYDSASCLKCHPSGQAGEIDRSAHSTKFFPIATGKHGNAECASCHATPDKKEFTCIGCHEHAQPEMDGKHSSIAGYAYDSSACLKCHADGTAMFDHKSLGPKPTGCYKCHQDKFTAAKTTPASLHVTNRFPTTCENCHTSFTSWKQGSSMQHAAVGGSGAACEKCHMAGFKAAVTPFDHVGQNIPATSCNTCHTDFATWTKFVHNPSSCYDGATGRPHEKATCAQCHTSSSSGDYKTTTCTACHRDRGKNCN